MTWPEIGEAIGLTDRAARRIHASFLALPAEPSEDPMQLIVGHLDVLRAVLVEAAEASVAAKQGSAAQVGALRLMIEASAAGIGVRQAVGLMPRSLGDVRRDHDLALLFAELIDVLERHEVGDEVIADVHQVAESLARPPALPGPPKSP